MERFQIIFYTKANGEQPARDFLDGLSPKMSARFAKLIVMLRECGGKLRMPYSEYLKDGIFQIWAHRKVILPVCSIFSGTDRKSS